MSTRMSTQLDRGRARALPALSERRLLRYGAFTGLYIAQGLPEGLLTIALPAVMAERGLSTAEIGWYTGIAVLPWSFKLVGGVLIDRFSFLPMGRRRPWVLGAQLGLVLGLLVLASMRDPFEHLFWLATAAFFVNLSAALQDVAVDGMAVDLLPAGEQGRANGLMWGGKVAGIAGAAAMGAWMVNAYGFGSTMCTFALLVMTIMLIPLLLRERSGERLLPWSPGRASEAAGAVQLRDWRGLLRSLLQVALLPASLLAAAAVFAAGAGSRLLLTWLPVLAVQELSWDSAAWSQRVGTAGLVAGAFGMLVGGILVDRLGKVRTTALALLLNVALAILMGSFPVLWSATILVSAYVFLIYSFHVVYTIGSFATAMKLCWKRVAATQFTFYMAAFNLGMAAGASLAGPLDGLLSYGQIFFVVAAAWGIALVLFALIDLEKHAEQVDLLEARETRSPHRATSDGTGVSLNVEPSLPKIIKRSPGAVST